MPRSTTLRSRFARAATAGTVLASVLAATLSLAGTAPASAQNRVTPGNFTGYGFDQCIAPTQAAMDAWLFKSPYWAVGIYTSGNSRACRVQPNLTPEWVTTQLKNRWRLLPITLGPQASCSARFPRYGPRIDPTINPDSTSGYLAARRQGRAEADAAVAAATALGITPKSTLWYDLEAFDIGKAACRESALRFIHAWTNRLHRLDFVSGMYSSAASGIKMLDDARVNRPATFSLPDRIWIADWNGRADVHSSYIRSDGWMPKLRMHQYRGGHDESYGGVTINIDQNFIDLGLGSVPAGNPRHCGGVELSRARYPRLVDGSTGDAVKVLQCLLKEQELYGGRLHGSFGTRTQNAVLAFRAAHGMPARPTVSRRVWTALLSAGATPLVKYGAANDSVRRLQRALNAADRSGLTVTGTFESTTTTAVKLYQQSLGLKLTGVVTPFLWAKLQTGAI